VACYTFLGGKLSVIFDNKSGRAAGRLVVKLENYTYNLVMKTLELLENQYNYKVADNVKKEIVEAVLKDMDSLISQS
jgi:hypothetical protein